MSLDRVMVRLGAGEAQLSIVADALLNDTPLQSLAKKLGHPRESAYALASAYATEVMQESVSEIAPRMADERQAMYRKQVDDRHDLSSLAGAIESLEAYQARLAEQAGPRRAAG